MSAIERGQRLSVSVAHERLCQLSFPDAQVEHVELDLHAKQLTLRVDGAWLDGEGAGRIGAGELVVTGWEQLEVRRYDHERDTWSRVAFAPLRDICEFCVDAARIVLRGFARSSGLWTEVAATGAQTRGTYLLRSP